MRQRMMQMLSMADVIEPTLEEARIITGCTAISDVLRALHAAGPPPCRSDAGQGRRAVQLRRAGSERRGHRRARCRPPPARVIHSRLHLPAASRKMCGWRTPSPSATAPGRWYAPSAVPSAWRSPTREQVLDMMRLHPARLHVESLQALYEKEHKHEIA